MGGGTGTDDMSRTAIPTLCPGGLIKISSASPGVIIGVPIVPGVDVVVVERS